METDHPNVIGLIGGIGSGKTTVAQMFAELGAKVIDADAVVAAVLKSRNLAEKLSASWGKEFLDASGLPNRAKIAEKVFNHPESLKEWESWVHPPVLKKMREELELDLHNPAISVIILDAPLLLEAGLESWCDAILFVDTDASLRAERARASRGWQEGEIQRRESAQASLNKKRGSADFVVTNNGSREETLRQVKRLFRQWTVPTQT